MPCHTGRKKMLARSLSISSRFAFACVLAVSLLFTGAAFAQSTATIQGTVLDATGASVPNAAVTVRNQNTAAARATQTDPSGPYLAPPLPAPPHHPAPTAPPITTIIPI